MVRVRRVTFGLLFALAACGGASSNARPAGSHDGAWRELRVSWDFGPCPDDGRSCHQTLSVHADGGFVATETPNSTQSGGTAEPVRRFASLTPDEIRDVHSIVDAPGFLDKLGSFDCPPEQDATVRIEVEGPSGTKQQEVGGCVHSSDANAQSSPPRALVELLAHHRFASRDAKPAQPRLPSSEGDACNASAGCAAGLVCVVAPCVVAPCVNGTCHKAGK